MVEVSSFPENEIASRLHHEGLVFESTKKFGAAHEKFADARSLLLPGNTDFDNPMKPAAILQLARIDRDDGFTFAREAISKNGEPEKLKEGFNMMRGAKQSTEDLIARGLFSFSIEAWRKLMSEHGATIGTLFRLSVINHVVLEGVADNTPVEAYTQPAWSFLIRGSNYYYAANHAMNVARYERITVNGADAARWFGRAGFTAIGAFSHDRANAWNVSRTVAARLPQLRTKRAARASINSRP